MKEYQFQFTKMRDTLTVAFSSSAVFILMVLLGIYFELHFIITIIISFALAFFLYQFFKQKVIRNCTANLSDTFVKFDFGDSSRVINFKDLISFKAYYGNNGPVLYLKNNVDNFEISANNNYCKTDDFRVFCEDTIIQLGKYKKTNNPDLLHKGSIFATQGMLYFLIVATSIYLVAFFIENKESKLYVGIGGGVYLLVFWILFFTKRESKK